MIGQCNIETARAELYAIAAQHNHNFQHEAVQAASQRLDVLINVGQKRRIQEARKDEIPNDRHRRRARSFD